MREIGILLLWVTTRKTFCIPISSEVLIVFRNPSIAASPYDSDWTVRYELCLVIAYDSIAVRM